MPFVEEEMPFLLKIIYFTCNMCNVLGLCVLIFNKFLKLKKNGVFSLIFALYIVIFANKMITVRSRPLLISPVIILCFVSIINITLKLPTYRTFNPYVAFVMSFFLLISQTLHRWVSIPVYFYVSSL